MTIFLINITLIILEGFWMFYKDPSQSYKKRFCILASLQWILISGLRGTSVGADTEQYFNNFERIKTYSWEYVLDFTRTQLIVESDEKAPGYTLLVKVFQIFSDDYQVFLVSVAILFFCCMGYSIYKNSKNPVLSYVLFSCLFYSFFAITGSRQTIATAIVVFVGIEFIKKRKLIPFLICIAICSTVHLSVICFLPFYWIAKIPITKNSISVYWILVILSYIFRIQFLSILQFLVGYEEYEQTEGARAGTFVFLLIAVAVVITAFHKIIIKKNIHEISMLEIDSTVNKKEIPMLQLSMNATFVACIFSSLLLINQNTMRVVQYYSIFLMFLLPEMPKMFVSKRDELIYNVIVAGVLITSLFDATYQYSFFWQSI